jgi:hypothetical protein
MELSGVAWSLLGVVDNGGGSDPFSGNTLVSFSLAPSAAGDFNGDGAVSGPDYVTWRKGLGTVFEASHYSVWRSNYGPAAGRIAASGNSGALSVPETSAPSIVFAAIFSTFYRRRRGTTSPRQLLLIPTSYYYKSDRGDA